MKTSIYIERNNQGRNLIVARSHRKLLMSMNVMNLAYLPE